MKRVEGISQNKSILKSNGRGSLKSTRARRWPTRMDGKKFLDDDLALVDKSKQEKKNPCLNFKICLFDIYDETFKVTFTDIKLPFRSKT